VAPPRASLWPYFQGLERGCGGSILSPVTVVSARGLVKTFGQGRTARTVLDGINLEVTRGEIVAIKGRSGSGKSTLLHLLGALDRPDGGALTVAGTRLERASERTLTDFRRRRVGFVFQFFHLVPELTGEENVVLPARLISSGPSAVRRGRRLIAELELEHVADALPHTLSGGEQQRFAVARALVNDPALVLADEPTGNLDADSGRRVLAILREIAANDGRAVVLVTHEPEAAAIADRVLHLNEGRLVPGGDPGRKPVIPTISLG
jgi:ABC-type lipoprotein export system ATPase subunit